MDEYARLYFENIRLRKVWRTLRGFTGGGLDVVQQMKKREMMRFLKAAGDIEIKVKKWGVPKLNVVKIASR
jgi:hypothetical protein